MYKIICIVVLIGVVNHAVGSVSKGGLLLAGQPKSEKLTVADSFNLVTSPVQYPIAAPYYANHYTYEKYLVPTAPVYYQYEGHHQPNYAYPTYSHQYNHYDHHVHGGLQGQPIQAHGGLLAGQGLHGGALLGDGLQGHGGLHGHGGIQSHVAPLVGQYQAGHNAHHHHPHHQPLQHFDYIPQVYDHGQHYNTHGHYNSYTPVYHSNYNQHGRGYYGHGRRHYNYNLGYPLYTNRLHRFGHH